MSPPAAAVQLSLGTQLSGKVIAAHEDGDRLGGSMCCASPPPAPKVHAGCRTLPVLERLARALGVELAVTFSPKAAAAPGVVPAGDPPAGTQPGDLVTLSAPGGC